MKNLKVTILCALLAMASGAASQTVTLTVSGDVDLVEETSAKLTCSMENSMEMAGWQMLLYLPAGVDIACEEEDGERYYDNTVVLSSRHKRSHTCTVTPTADGGYLIMAYNPSKPTAITGNSGELLTITLQRDETYTDNHQAVIRSVAASDMNSVQTNMVGEVLFTIKGPVPTGIRPFGTDSTDGPVYDLSGRRIQQPTKGVNIVGGNKVVVK